MHHAIKSESILAIDYGEARIGLAFGRDGISTPLKVISGKNHHTAIAEIAKMANSYDASKIVMGLPLTLEDKETPESLEVRKFTKLLRIKLKKPVEFVNEFRSSEEAPEIMIDMGISKKSRRTKDHYSAALILRRYYREVA